VKVPQCKLNWHLSGFEYKLVQYLHLKMKGTEITKRIKWVPAWLLSLFAALMSAVVIGVLNNYIDEPLTYIIWSLMLVTASFLICILYPMKVWIVPLLCNILAILPAACDNSFWVTSFGIIIGSGVVLSFVMAHLGAMIGKQRDKQSAY
jgi:hypothetical protein